MTGRAPGAPGRPAILFFHGGSFAKTGGSVAQFQYHAQHFAALGYVCLCVECRNGADPEFSPVHAISDARDAFAWVVTHAEDLGLDAGRIAMCGASSGGYTVLCSVMLASPLLAAIAPWPRALVIFNAGVNGVEITNRLFPQLADQGVDLSPLHCVEAGMPPLLGSVGTADTIYDDNKRFCTLWQEHGNACEFIEYEDMEHGFFNFGRHNNVPYNDSIQRMTSFLRRELAL